VDGNGKSRVLHITSRGLVSISGLTITNSNVVSENGGGILNDHAMLMMDSCAVQFNGGQFNNGGGVYNDASGGSATLMILNSTVAPSAGITPTMLAVVFTMMPPTAAARH
jgi:hypothetical protein